MDNKLPYEAPEIRLLGAVRDLTQGHASGSVTDALYPAGTPNSELTFSF
ncbi:MAG: lasso RiPP family leader peptide-containing protein [Actinomycetota bacterium]